MNISAVSVTLRAGQSLLLHVRRLESMQIDPPDWLRWVGEHPWTTVNVELVVNA